MDASALVVLRCCGSDVPAFAAALAAAMRASRPERHVIVEVADGDVMWRPPVHAPTIPVRLVLVCGERLDAARLQPPETTRPVHLTAVVVAPDGRDPAQPVQAVALPRVFVDVVGVAGAAAMLHGLVDGEEREEARDTDEWLAPDEDDFGVPRFDDDGTVPPWPTIPEGASGLDAFRGSVPPPPARPASSASAPGSPARIETVDSAVREFVLPVASPDATVIVTSRPAPAPAPAAPAAAPIEPLPPPRRAAAPAPPPPPVTSQPEAASAALPPGPAPSPSRRRTSQAKAAPPASTDTAASPASPAAKVKKGLKRIAGAVEDLAASVVNAWILRAPSEVPEPSAGGAAPASPPAVPETAAADRAPVALGASAPRTAAPGSEFTARFIAHVPGRERAIAAAMADPGPDARVPLNLRPCQWTPGTAVTVTLRARGLQVEPSSRTFTWRGDEHVEEFGVTVPADATPGTLVLTFDAAIDGFVVATLRVDLVVTADTGARKARTSATTTAARTAFASYSSADRARVRDRVAAVQTSAGLDVFLDCLSLHPGESRARLASEIRERDVFLLFWSASASASTEVEWEYRTAIDARGVEAVQLHPLDAEVPPPAPLAESHAGDALMWARRATAPRADA